MFIIFCSWHFLCMCVYGCAFFFLSVQMLFCRYSSIMLESHWHFTFYPSIWFIFGFTSVAKVFKSLLINVCFTIKGLSLCHVFLLDLFNFMFSCLLCSSHKQWGKTSQLVGNNRWMVNYRAWRKSMTRKLKSVYSSHKCFCISEKMCFLCHAWGSCVCSLLLLFAFSYSSHY